MQHDTHDTPADLPPATYEVRPPRLGKLPFVFIAVILCSVVGSWVPLSLFALARSQPSDKPRVQFIQDMGTQPKYREQQSSDVFADGRADRPRIAGTVARGHLDEDDHYYRGFTRTIENGKPAVKFFDDFPQQVQVDQPLLKRGQERFGIYCSPCHGLDGHGNGMVAQRAREMAEAKWIPPADVTAKAIRDRADGHIFNTINVGIRSMPGYGPQIPVADRWAIVAYVRALQISQEAPASAVPADKAGAVREFVPQ